MAARDDVIRETVEALDLGRPSARKSGRDPRWPYVPVLLHDDSHGRPGHTRQEQLLGVAYETRGEAVAYAEGHLVGLRRDLERKLAMPTGRALREQHGLPRDLSEVGA